MNEGQAEIETGGETSHEIDPEDDVAGLMREMGTVRRQKTINESINSETSTDTAFSINAQTSDKEEMAMI